jgi:rod shape-determining protein MreD
MVFVLYIPAVLWAFALQTSSSVRVLGPGWHVDLALLVVIAFALLRGGPQALLLGFITGLIHDLISSDLFGLGILIKSLAAFVVLSLSSLTLWHSAVTQSLIAGLAISLATLIRFATLSTLRAQPLPIAEALHVVAPHVVLGMVIMPLMCKGLFVLERALHLSPKRGQRHVAN